MTTLYFKQITILLVLFISSSINAQEVVELKSISIIGNPELPKTIYLVPWKKTGPGDLGGRPGSSLLDEDLGPVDPQVFRRELEYYQAGFAIQ